ncbi:MAG: penicillin-binding protein 2 [Chitinispirillaceae bacterium]|nr:penicillin-binding protein 2 [Chitinispirillaceae bacterium]
MPYGAIFEDDHSERKFKNSVIIIAFCSLVFILFLRLFYLQIIEAEENIRLSKENAMRLKILFPPRGRIFDKYGRILAQNRPSYSICVLPYKLKNRSSVIKALCSIKDNAGNAIFDSTELEKIFTKAYQRRFDATRLKEDVSMDIVSIIEEHSMELPGIIVEKEARREYPLSKATFHLLGYMSEIPEEQFDSLKKKGYFYGDLIGKAGVELKCESSLRGICGKEYIEVNAYGKSLGPIKGIPRIDPIPGNDIYLTIDGALQIVCDYAFPDTLRGAVVILDPRNGEVLALYSSPSVDPNIFSMSSLIRTKMWQEITTDPAQPLNNRAIYGTYTPGSTFKLISALAALEAGDFTADTRMPQSCGGFFRIGNRIAHCWKKSGHGRLNLIGAVQQSCNVYMFQLGLKLGDKILNNYAVMMGLGEPTGIDIPGERAGWLSGEEAYNKRFASRGWKWTAGLVLDLAIGQAQIVTPIQLALMVGGLGNCNIIYRPFVVKEERNMDGILLKRNNPIPKRQLSFKPYTIETIREALLSVVMPGGTGGRAAVPGIKVGGKTGSAENPHGEETHALFVACAPVEDPVIAVAVVLENAGHGGAVAAPVAGEILRYFFSECPDGKEILKKSGADSATVAKLKEMVEPLRNEVKRYFP